ncbi:MAG: extracellular solute-binding protein [SAR324 cluster bacterium]|nr:extracellular solute-binding protein [SAR324 cluster bacterium]
MRKFWLLLFFLILSLPSISNGVGEVVVYSARQEHLIKPILDEFTKETGIKIKLHTDKSGPLLARLIAEKPNNIADLLITTDAGNLWLADKNDLLMAVDSTILNNNIPTHLRSPRQTWFGLSVRVRTIFYNKDLVKAGELSTYQDLASSKWKGKLCLRTSKSIYNKSLVAMMIADYGYKNAKQVVTGWVNNLATKVFSSDTSLLKAIDAGQCHVGLANSYYLGRLLAKQPNFKATIFWANQQDNGAHVNISGAGIIKNGKNAKEAKILLEFLSLPKAQKIFADLDFEYPANPKVKEASLIKNWGEFKANLINVSKAGELQVSASILMDRVKYH